MSSHFFTLSLPLREIMATAVCWVISPMTLEAETITLPISFILVSIISRMASSSLVATLVCSISSFT